jgi:hypothetical protein
LGCSVEHVLYNVSYRNLLLYSAATPQFDDEKSPKWDASKDANNPDNFKPAKAASTDTDNKHSSEEEEEEFIKDI